MPRAKTGRREVAKHSAILELHILFLFLAVAFVSRCIAYGARGGSQHEVYTNWTETVYNSGMNGDLFWMISGETGDGNSNYWVPNYDGYAVYCPDNSSQPSPPGDIQSCPVLHKSAQQMAG